MKYIPSIAFEEMSGSAKGVTAASALARCVGSCLEQVRTVSGRPQLDSIQILSPYFYTISILAL